jgi:hypothetical protein
MYYPNKYDYNNKFWKHNYLITIDGIEFTVNADNEQEAFDYLIDFSEEFLPGLIMSNEEEIELEHFLEDYVCGGNHGKYINSYNISINTINHNE